MSAEPIVPQSIHNATTDHQSLLDRIEQTLTGAWHALDSILPAHELRDTVLNNVKAAYDNSAKIVKDDLEKSLAEAAPIAETAVSDVESAVVSGAENVVKDVAEAVTPTTTTAETAAAPASTETTSTSSTGTTSA